MSRGAAIDRSPRREPWEKGHSHREPRRGGRNPPATGVEKPASLMPVSARSRSISFAPLGLTVLRAGCPWLTPWAGSFYIQKRVFAATRGNRRLDARSSGCHPEPALQGEGPPYFVLSKCAAGPRRAGTGRPRPALSPYNEKGPSP